MKRNDNCDFFLDRLIFLNRKIELLGKLNLNDTSIHAEDFYKNLFNQLLGLNLINLNTLNSNAEAVDLLDSTKKIIIQVTATCEKRKVENTLSKKALQKYANEGYKIQFIFIGIQNKNIKSNSFKNPFGIEFNPKKDIFLTLDIIKQFNNLNIPIQKNILELINLELPKINLLDNKTLKKDTCIEISQLLRENKLIWEKYGPNSIMSVINPLEETTFDIWNSRKQELIINNKKIIELFNKSENLFDLEERKIFSDFKEHEFSFRTNDIKRIDSAVYIVFPHHFSELIDNILEEKEG